MWEQFFAKLLINDLLDIKKKLKVKDKKAVNEKCNILMKAKTLLNEAEKKEINLWKKNIKFNV